MSMFLAVRKELTHTIIQSSKVVQYGTLHITSHGTVQCRTIQSVVDSRGDRSELLTT